MSEADQGREPVSDVTWETPPSVRVRYDWRAIAEHLRQRPGQWAKIFDDDKTSLVNALRQGSIKVLDPDLGFQCRTRNNTRYPTRRCTLYMRWVPPVEKE